MSELIFASANRQEAYKISKMLQEKQIRKIANSRNAFYESDEGKHLII